MISYCYLLGTIQNNRYTGTYHQLGFNQAQYNKLAKDIKSYQPRWSNFSIIPLSMYTCEIIAIIEKLYRI
jgi:hypothetical protein